MSNLLTAALCYHGYFNVWSLDIVVTVHSDYLCNEYHIYFNWICNNYMEYSSDHWISLAYFVNDVQCCLKTSTIYQSKNSRKLNCCSYLPRVRKAKYKIKVNLTSSTWFIYFLTLQNSLIILSYINNILIPWKV